MFEVSNWTPGLTTCMKTGPQGRPRAWVGNRMKLAGNVLLYGRRLDVPLRSCEKHKRNLEHKSRIVCVFAIMGRLYASARQCRVKEQQRVRKGRHHRLVRSCTLSIVSSLLPAPVRLVEPCWPPLRPPLSSLSRTCLAAVRGERVERS